jgi:hypothetical protein
MDFIRELTEARMTRTESNTKRLSYTDCCERAYLCLLIIETLRKFPRYNDKAKIYAKNTVRYTGYDYFRSTASDLYNFIYFITGDDKAMEKLREPDDARELRRKTVFPEMRVNGYLSSVALGSEPRQVPELFLKLERVFGIRSSDYKVIRRVLTNFHRARPGDISKAVTKLLYAARTRLRSSDIISDIESLAAERNLEDPDVKDSQPPVSRVDQVLDQKDYIYLKKIVGTQNLYLAIKYIELSKKGSVIPSNMARAMNPAIELVLDIIKGGPTYTQRLIELQKLANKEQKTRQRRSKRR